MERIKLVFPDETVVFAKVNSAAEPELAKSLLSYLDGTTQFVCDHTVTAGSIFALRARPGERPMAKTAGKTMLKYTELKHGQILWDGQTLSVVYGPCTKPGVAGALVAEVEPEFNKKFDRACMEVWYGVSREHVLGVMTVEKEVA